MTNNDKDAICQLWIEIFGTQEGAGYNCPQGAYDFAKVVMAYERELCAKSCEIWADKFDMAPVNLAKNCAATIRARADK